MIKKSLLLTLLLALFVPWAAQAYNHQVQVGTGTSGQNIAPINLYYNYSYTQQIYTADQINAECVYVGDIESISFYYAGSVAKTVPITVFMKTTDKTSFSSTSDWETVTEDDIVFNGDWEIPSTAGWVTITLNAPFAYDGESNLLIAIDKGYYDNYTNQSWRYTAVTNNQMIQYRSDSTDPNPYSPTTASGISQNLPNIQFNMTIARPAPSALTLDEVVINTATISWTAPQTTNTITGYAYEYTDGETIETGTVTGTTANLSELTAATDYLFQVKAIYSDGESCWSETLDFTTLEACMTPENLTISDVFAHTATLNWTEGFGDGQWVLQYKLSTEEEYTNSVDVALTDLPYTLTGLTAESTYNVLIAPVCDATKTIAGTFTTTVACPTPTGLAFTLTPGDGTVATFSWSENGSATAWQLCINGDEDNLIDMDENPFTYNGFTPEETYTAKVRAVCGGIDGESQWSSTVTFTPTNAYMLTVNDGTDTHSYVPFYGYYADSDANSQFIIPASALSSMAWGTINKITFYGGTASATWNGAVFDIYFSEVNNTEFESAALVDWSELESKVYTGSVSVVDNKMELTLTAPYQYMGGNLLIGFDETTNSSNYPQMSWYGVTQTTNTAVYKYSTYNATLAKFLPKTTFDYVPGEEPACIKPTGLIVNYTGGTTAEVSWTSDATVWNIQYFDDNNEYEIEVTENPYTLTGLSLGTLYGVMVQAICGEDNSEWTDAVSFTTDFCMPENQCEITILLTDSYNDGWNGGKLEVVDVLTEDVLGTFTLTSGGEGTFTLAVCDGRDINLVYTAGSYAYENGWVITDINEEVISEHTGGNSSNPPTEGIVATYTVNCTVTDCRKPTDLAATEITAHTAVLSWTENGVGEEPVTEWVVAYLDDSVGEVGGAGLEPDKSVNWIEMTVTENPFTYVGLFAETEYTWKVRSAGCEDKWSDEATFTTTEACLAPTSLAAEVEGATATITWESSATYYTLDINGTEYEEVTSPYVFNGELATTYEVKVKAVCGGEDGESVWTNPISFTTDMCMPENQCEITLTLTDSYGDGWNGNVIQVVDVETDMVLATLTNVTNDHDNAPITETYTLSVCDGRELQFNYVVGTGSTYPSENSWVITDVNGETIWEYNSPSANMTQNYTVSCAAPEPEVIVWNDPTDWPVPDSVNIQDVYIPDNTDVIIPTGCIAYANMVDLPETSTITMEPGSQFYHSNEIPVTVQMQNTGYSETKDNVGGFHLIASPVSTSVEISTTGLVSDEFIYDLYYFDQAGDEEGNEWINYNQGEGNAPGFTELYIQKGYLYASENTIQAEFVGSTLPTNADVSVALDYVAGKRFAGWNLVGNPFTCMAYIDKPYYALDPSGSVLASVEGNSVEVMEGIFVKVDSLDLNPTVTFSTVDAGGDLGGDPLEPDKGNLVLNLSHNNALVDRAIVRFDEGHQLPKLQLNPNSTEVYIPMDGVDYAIVNATEMGEMPVSFKAERNDTYTLSFSSENVGFNYLHLVDNMTGADVDLLVNPSYSFEAKTTDYASRFKLVFATGDNSNDDNFAFFSNGNFVINNDGEATLQVVDVMGRILSSKTINGSASVNVNAAPGVYMLRLINGNDVKVQKVVVR